MLRRSRVMWGASIRRATPQVPVAVIRHLRPRRAVPRQPRRSDSSDRSMGSTIRATSAQSAVSASVTAGADT